MGLFEYNGNTRNNICCLAFGPVINDSSDRDPRRRYKMIAKGPPRENGKQMDYAVRGHRVFYSEDGMRWNEHVRGRKGGTER